MDPHPPPKLAGKDLPLLKFREPLCRIHFTPDHPLYFSRNARHRFDAPDRSYGVLYAAEDVYGAFVETLGHVTGENIVQESDLAQRSATMLELRRELTLVDLRGRGLARVGADARLCSGDYTVAQRWSQAFFLRSAKIDGIAYPARHDPGKTSFAVFDRAREGLRPRASQVLLLHPELPEILDYYGFGLV